MEEVEIINGTLTERKTFLENQIEGINSLLSENKDMICDYDENMQKNDIRLKFNLTSYDGKYRWTEKDLEYMDTILPIKTELVKDLKDRICVLSKQIKEDIKCAYIDYATLMKGFRGEELVEKSLSLYENRYKLIKNLRIELDGRSSESDVLIICEKGVFAIEIKNYGNSEQTLEISPDGKWSLKDTHGRKIKDLNDVADQNNYHCSINQTLINNELKAKGYTGKFIDCESIICIGNNNVDIKNNSNQHVVRASNIISEIKNFKSDLILSEEIQQEIYDILSKHNLDEKTFEVCGRYNRIKSNFTELKELLSINNDIEEVSKSYEYYIKNIR